QVGKVRKLGILPVKFDVQVQYFPVRPQVGGPRWNLQLQVTPILPGLIKRKLFGCSGMPLRSIQARLAVRRSGRRLENDESNEGKLQMRRLIRIAVVGAMLMGQSIAQSAAGNPAAE